MKNLPPITKPKKGKSFSLDTKNSTKTNFNSAQLKNPEIPAQILTTKKNPNFFLQKDRKTPSFTRLEPEKKVFLSKKIAENSLIQIKKPKPLLLKNREKPSLSLHIKPNIPLKATLKL